MKIKALQTFAHKTGKSFAPGKEYDVTEASAKEFERANLAEIVEVAKNEKPLKKD